MKIIIGFLVTVVVIYLSAKFLRKVHVKGFSSAVVVALLVALFNFLIGWLLRLLLNVATLGIFYFTGLTFVISIIVNALIIELVDQLLKGFKTDGFLPSLVLAVILAIVNAIMAAVFF